MRRNGFTLVELIVVMAITAVLVGLLLGAVQRVRAAAARASCANNVRQLGIALHSHHVATGSLPPGIRVRNDKMLYASWVTRILPHLDQVPAWNQAVADYGTFPIFAGLTPHRSLSQPLPVVLCPSGFRSIGTTDDGITAAFTYYLGVSGKNGVTPTGVLYLNSAVRFADITDGTSQTLLVGERPPSPDNHFGWWYAGQGQVFDGSADFLLGVADGNRTFRAPTCPPGPYPFGPGKPDDMCDTFHFWSLHNGGANFLFCDGSVRFMVYSSASIMPALSTRAGGEVVAFD